MSSTRAILRGPLRRADAALWTLRDSMTPGQRWTGALAMGLALAVLLVGQPIVRVTQPTSALAAPPEAPPTAVEEPAPIATVPAPEAEPREVAPPVLPDPVAPPEPAAPPEEPVTADLGPTAPAVVPRFIALVPSAPPTTPPGRDEATIASGFLDQATVNATTLTYDPDADDLAATCEVAADRGAVLAATPLPRVLRTCLEAAGLIVLGHDEAIGPGSASISTRPAIGDALRSAATWAGTTGGPLLDGTVGLAVDPRLEPDVEPVLAELTALGVDVAIVQYVTSVRDSVRAFADAGVEVTVFALTTELQREWVALSQLLLPGGRYVVVDAADAVTAGAGYSPSFDGARYVGTALPTDEPTPAQQRCLDRYGTEPVTGDERTLVLGWCQLSDLVDAAAARTRSDGIPFDHALTTLTFDSPLTAPLGPATDGGWRPAPTHELVWRATCSCWRPPADTAAATVRRWELHLSR